MPDPTSVAYGVVATSYAERFLDELDDRPRERAMLERFAAAVDGPVVDLGCGPGQVGAHVRRTHRPVLGADLTPGMARLAAARLDAVTVADVRCLPFADRSVGGVVAFYSLIHLTHAERPLAFGELARVLRPGGRLLVAAQEGEGTIVGEELAGHAVSLVYAFYAADALRALAEGAGLAVVAADRRDTMDGERFPRLFLEAERPR